MEELASDEKKWWRLPRKERRTWEEEARTM